MLRAHLCSIRATVILLSICSSLVLAVLDVDDNRMLGTPEIICTQEGVEFTMETEKPFQGQLYVKDEYYNDKCRASFGDDKKKPGVAFRLTFNECGMRRQRMHNPRGIVYSTVMMVQFHQVFVTSGDRAYQIKCFYSEQQTNLTSALDVSPLTTQLMEATFAAPACVYSIHQRTADGPQAAVVQVGDSIMHVFTCNFATDVYKILIKDCYVDDGKQQRQRLIDENGCSLDESIMQTPVYQDGRLRAIGESTVFKWPDESVVYFSCQIALCMNDESGCDQMTPPKCEKVQREKRLANDQNSPISPLEFDLEVKKLTVVDSSGVRAMLINQIQPVLHQESETESRNSTLLDYYLKISHNQSLINSTSSTNRTIEHPAGDELFDFDDAIWRAAEQSWQSQACFGVEALLIFIAMFTVFIVVLTATICKLCSPWCTRKCASRSLKINDRLIEDSGVYQQTLVNCWSTGSNVSAEGRYEDQVVYQHPLYPSKQLYFSKLHLQV